jgi:hypothetical protein
MRTEGHTVPVHFASTTHESAVTLMPMAAFCQTCAGFRNSFPLEKSSAECQNISSTVPSRGKPGKAVPVPKDSQLGSCRCS